MSQQIRRLQERLRPSQLKYEPVPWEQLREQAEVMLHSGFFPAHFRTVEQVLAVMLMARDLNIPATVALQHCWVNERTKKLASSTMLLLALARRTGKVGYTKGPFGDHEAMYFVLKRSDEEVSDEDSTYSFTIEEARMLLGSQVVENPKGAWVTQRANMLGWRSVGKALRFKCPELLLQYNLEELGAPYVIDEDGEIVLENAAAAPGSAAPEAKPPAPAIERGESQGTPPPLSGKQTTMQVEKIMHIFRYPGFTQEEKKDIRDGLLANQTFVYWQNEIVRLEKWIQERQEGKK